MACSCNTQNKTISKSEVSEITSAWNFYDYLGSIRVRMSLGRNDYSVQPGLYKIGIPNEHSAVLVSANYKLSFDILRRNLNGLDSWILVLDTKGINVWCAAGKGTFGTEELISKINQTELGKYVTHRKLIVPQLGAPGIAAHSITKATGFKVKYGPVRAADIKAFISSGLKASESMRTVNFRFKDRLLLTPVEIVNSVKYLLMVLLLFIFFSGIRISGASLGFSFHETILPVIAISTAYVAGTFLTPIFLPWLPSRYFAAKGLAMAGIVFIGLSLVNILSEDAVSFIGWFLLSLAISSFLAMNFTGASTFTSLSGVKKEMKLFIPIQMSLSVVGLGLLIISKFFLA